MTKVSRSVDISAPVAAVFAYYARPEHIAKSFPADVSIRVTPVKVKDNFGVGTIFRISGNFGGRELEWDNETTEYEDNRLIKTKAINGPFKKNDIAVHFQPMQGGTKLTFEADYELGYGLLGAAIDKLKIKKEVEMGIEKSCSMVKRYLENGQPSGAMAAEIGQGN
ncbi:MAG: SRPBCC family protein [Nitrososphaerota archaeon]|nr:SRPBCC family protein [Nitrososphaerota archaeon]MDG7010689.1 SRPBCC family protein [Nitrososphaerota archaeon]